MAVMAALDRAEPKTEPFLRAAPVRRQGQRALGLTAVWTVVLANAAVIVWLWIHGGNLTLRSGHDIAHAVTDALLASAPHAISDVTVHIEPLKMT